MIIDDVYTYLSENVSSLTGGTNLYKTRQSDSPANQTVIYDTGGAEPERYLPLASPSFQILVRNTSYATGYGVVQDIVDALHQQTNVQLVDEENYFYYIFLMGEPAHIGRDEKGRHEWSINFISETRR